LLARFDETIRVGTANRNRPSRIGCTDTSSATVIPRRMREPSVLIAE
jgi:hypothetical protein